MRAIVGAIFLGLSAWALLLVRSFGGEHWPDDAPAVASAALKLRLAWSGLAIAAVAALLPFTADVPLYGALLLFFAGIPLLGHQAIGLTAWRGHSRSLRRAWLLSVLFPLLVIAFGVGLLVARQQVAEMVRRNADSSHRAARTRSVRDSRDHR